MTCRVRANRHEAKRPGNQGSATMGIASLRRRFGQGSESQYCLTEAASNGLFGRRQYTADRLTVPSLRREFLLSAARLSPVISCTALAPISVMVTRMSLAKSSSKCETPRCPATANA
jgi:hypothetical protein